MDGSAGDAEGKKRPLIELPESFFRAPGGESIHFNDIAPEDEAISNGELAFAPSLASMAPASRRGAGSRLALFASVALHVLAAASLLTWVQDAAKIAGGTPNKIAGLGNASTDQTASGEAVNVTITTMPVVRAQPVEPQHAIAEPAPVEEAAAPKPMRETAAQAEPLTEARHIQPAEEPVEAARVEGALPAETPPEEDEPRLAEHVPLPKPRPERVEKSVEKAEKRAPDSERKKPVRAAARTSAPGSGGRNSADARRGIAEGRSEGRAASSNDNSRAANAAGNADVSNYPGKILARLRRALRYPSEARGQRLNGTAQVRFVVGRSGEVGSVQLAASSGSPILDEAALATVQRAAPFPPIPESAGRSSWTFTVPLAFMR